MMAVDGAAARALGDLARERWRRCSGKQVAPVAGTPDRWPEGLRSELQDVPVAIARTEPAHNGFPEVREVEALYLDAIRAARRFIYVENQYFTSARVGEAIEARLAEPDGPEVVIVLRQQCRGWLEEAVMGALRARLIRRLRAADRYGRLAIYHPLVPGPGEGFVNVHSKVMVVDDCFVRVGSANLNNRSMGLDSECDLAIEARKESTRLAIAGFRDRLLAEHLGVDSERVAAELARTGSLGRTVMALATGERRLEPIDDLEQWPETVESVAELADPERPVSIDALTQEFLPVTAPERSRVNGWGKLLGMLMGIAVLFALWRFTPLREMVAADAVGQLGRDFRQPTVGAACDPAGLCASERDHVPQTAHHPRCRDRLRPMAGVAVLSGGNPDRGLVGICRGPYAEPGSTAAPRRKEAPRAQQRAAQRRLGGDGAGPAGPCGALRPGEPVRRRGTRGPGNIRTRYRHRYGARADRHDGLRIAGGECPGQRR